MPDQAVKGLTGDPRALQGTFGAGQGVQLITAVVQPLNRFQAAAQAVGNQLEFSWHSVGVQLAISWSSVGDLRTF